MEDSEKKYWLRSFLAFLKDKFDLDADKAQQAEVVDNICKGVEFRGTNLWVLIFATFVASLGLNVNSTAVIIGAMLISPLMGPIMGIGLSLGINNFELMKRSLRNFGFMIVVSIITSTLYFIVSPLSNAQSELLARTMPTTYDVLIAFFGGLAGIVAQSRKDRTSTVIPGVAIATALMPPLCTAGFGLATGQFSYFMGAFYLFFINTVFIALATYVIVRFMKYDKKVFLDKQREKRVKQYMLAIVLITLVPSIILGYRIVQRTIFETNADRYVKAAFQFPNTQILDYEKAYKDEDGRSWIKLMLIGDPLSQDAIDNAKAQMLSFGLHETELIVRQADGAERLDLGTLQMSYSEILDEKNRQIADLRRRLQGYVVDTMARADISREASLVVENIERMSLSTMIEYDRAGRPIDTSLVCVIKPEVKELGVDTVKLSRWLSIRTKNKQVKIYSE